MNYKIIIKQYQIKNHIQLFIYDLDESVHCGTGIIFQLHDDCYRTIYKFCQNNIANFLEVNGYVTIITKYAFNDRYSNYTFQLTSKSLLEVL
jgi:hypothetical protein